MSSVLHFPAEKSLERYPKDINFCLQGDPDLVDDILTICYSTSVETPWGDLYSLYIPTVKGVRYNEFINIGLAGYRALSINVFRIDNPDSLTLVIDQFNICTRGRSSIPSLLVGVYADLRTSRPRSDLFPSSLGPWIAECIGAVDYVECTDKHNIFEQAIHAFSTKNDFELIFDEKLQPILMDQAPIGSEWFSVLEEIILGKLNPGFPLQPREDLNSLRKEIQLESQSDRSGEFIILQCLEIKRIELSVECLKYETKTRILYSKWPSLCCLWYMPKIDSTSQNTYIYVSSHPSNIMAVQQNDKPANLLFVRQHCTAIIDYLIKTRLVFIRSLIIFQCSGVLDLSFLAKLKGLKYLVIVNTKVDIRRLTFPPNMYDTMNHLVLNNCEIDKEIEVPSLIGKLKNLTLLNVANNNFHKLPKTMASLKKLHTLILDNDKMLFPPAEVTRRPVQEVISFLEATQEDEVENKEAKLIVAGQEKVGKSTLIKAMKRSIWITKTNPPMKTDGIDISVLPLGHVKCKVYDLAGDVEYLNTHSLFLSSKSLHLVVFDLSLFIVSEETRSADNLCRLELWLQTIASQDPSADVIIVGTHADHPLISSDILQKHRQLVVQLLAKDCSTHSTSKSQENQKCMLCNLDNVPCELESLRQLVGCQAPKIVDCIVPHIVGYFEVSGMVKYPYSYFGVQNINVEKLKKSIAHSIANNMKITSTETIPRRWLSFRENIEGMLSSNQDLQQQPLMSLSTVHDIAKECNIFKKDKVIAMMRFFHCQGTFLWFEDLPEMKEVVIIDPQWLSDQLRTIISHRPSVCNFICDGVFSVDELPTLWANISEENRSKILSLFRSVGLCFSIAEKEELFPCNLPVGWPDEDMWSPLPKPSEKQISLLFLFSFVPPSFFPDLIVEVNKNYHSFARNVKPLYYRFHIVYITKEPGCVGTYGIDDESTQMVPGQDQQTFRPIMFHRVHYELMPYNNTLKVAIRGPHPRSILHDVRSTIETVKARRYPGITYCERLLCPECEIKKVRNPAIIVNEDHEYFCRKGHELGNLEDILNGKLSSSVIVPSAVHRTGRVVGETLQDQFCPKLFVILPINLESVSWKDRLVFSYLRDGYAVHLLCECPKQWHFVDSPGFRVGKPKEFFEKYGSRVCKVLQVISALKIPFQALSALDPHCKVGAAVGVGAAAANKELQSLLESYQKKYPHLHSTSGSTEDHLKYLKSSSGLQRSELSRFLEIEVKGHNFGPLVCTYVEKYNEWLWLCEEHHERFKIVERD